MKHLIELFRKNKIYYSLAFTSILLGLLCLLFLDKGELVLELNDNHTLILDNFFLGITKIGETIGGILIFMVLLLFAKRKFTYIFLISILLSLIVSQGLKRLVFSDEARPSATYENLKPVANLERHTDHSFPSGHTTAAFTFFTLLALGIEKRWVQGVAPVAASLVGISRVYLGQHYLNDIVAGAVVGLFLASVSVYLFHKYFPNKLE